MIKPPLTPACKYLELHLGKSENGIYYALLGDEYQLWVWLLAQSDGQMEWILKLNTSLNRIPKVHGPWISHHVTSGTCGDDAAPGEPNEFEWNSDDDDDEITLHNENSGQTKGYLEILAFHPYKEILFLHISRKRGLAYHLNSSKLEDLGDLSQTMDADEIKTCFPYTPCRMDMRVH